MIETDPSEKVAFHTEFTEVKREGLERESPALPPIRRHQSEDWYPSMMKVNTHMPL